MRDRGLLVVFMLVMVIENSETLVRNDRKESAWLADRSDDFKLDSDRCRQRADFNRRTRGIWFAVTGKILCVKFVVRREILFHVRQEHGDIDDSVPVCASVFEHEPDIFKHGATLRFDVVTDNVAGRIERHAGNFLTATLAWPDAGKEQKVANSFGVRKCTDRFGCTRALE